MKKIIGIVLLLLILIWGGFELSKYRFGYFVKGSEVVSPTLGRSSVEKIDGSKFLILGHNRPNVSEVLFEHDRNLTDIDVMNYLDMPTRIYDSNSGIISEIPVVEDFYYEPEGVLLDNKHILLIKVCKTNKTNKDAVIDCYQNLQMAIYDIGSNSYSLFKNAIMRDNVFLDIISSDKLLVIGGYPINALFQYYIPENLGLNSHIDNVETLILEYNLKDNTVNAVKVSAPNILINNDNVLKISNGVYILLSGDALYKFDYNKNLFELIFKDNHILNASSLTKISKNKISFINNSEFYIFDLLKNKIESKNVLKYKRKNQKIVQLTDDLLLIVGGSINNFPGSGLSQVSVTEFIDLATKKVYKGPCLGKNPIYLGKTDDNKFVFLAKRFFNSHPNIMVFNMYKN